MKIILASSSLTRRQQLAQLKLKFTSISPNVDETPYSEEQAVDLVQRLAVAKAMAVSQQADNALIIAGDQVGVNQQKITGKPHTETNAIEQLIEASGKTLVFYSGLSVLNTITKEIDTAVITTAVTFRQLSLNEITRYVKKSQPLNCAGSFNVDGLGISLFTQIKSDDPSALLGLPLIKLTSLLKKHKILLP